jgi:hypothetical protein
MKNNTKSYVDFKALLKVLDDLESKRGGGNIEKSTLNEWRSNDVVYPHSGMPFNSKNYYYLSRC